MESSEVQIETFEVCFVTTKSKEGSKNYLKSAFEEMETKGFEPVWITKETCLEVNERKNRLFVMDPFEGEAFEHLVSHECRIVGPLCILRCLAQSDTLPKKPYPVYSIVMRGINLTCSNLDKDSRIDIFKKVQLMGGHYHKDLTGNVTHLIAAEVGSKKYHVSTNLGIPVMLPSWIEELWENGQYQLETHATDPTYSKFSCPIFYGLTITVSQFGSTERNEMKSHIESNGGQYSGAMKPKDTTHVILMEPKGQKFNAAQQWKLHCVKSAWLFDSIEAGYCMDESLYLFEATKDVGAKRSTPIKEKSEAKFLIDCSIIPQQSMIQQSILSLQCESLNTSLSDALNSFDVAALPKNGQFLDGCKIYFSGFNSEQLEKIRKIVNSGGGMRFGKYNDSISHVVCGKKDTPFYESLKDSTTKPHVVDYNWLLECCKQGKMVDEGSFLIEEFRTVVNELSVFHEKPIEQRRRIVNSDGNDITLGEDFSDIFKQYSLRNVESNVRNVQNVNEHSLKENDGTNIITASTKKGNLPKKVQAAQIGVITEMRSSDDYTKVDTLFTGKKFLVIGFEQNDSKVIVERIHSQGGNVIDSTDSCQSDIAIVPLIWNSLNVKACVVVTNCWLQKCIEDSSVLAVESNELFKPFIIDQAGQPLKNLVLTFSQYTGTERDCLMYLAESLGARCQLFFVRKVNPARGLQPNTHLIACTPEGSKYEAAKKWKIPAVTKYWLLAAARTGKVPSVEHFFVGSEMSKDSTFYNNLVSLSKQNVTDADLCRNGGGLEEEVQEKSAFRSSTPKLSATESNHLTSFQNESDKRINENVCNSPSNRIISMTKQIEDPFLLELDVSGVEGVETAATKDAETGCKSTSTFPQHKTQDKTEFSDKGLKSGTPTAINSSSLSAKAASPATNCTPQNKRVKKLIENDRRFSSGRKKSSSSSQQETSFVPGFHISSMLRALDLSSETDSPGNNSCKKVFSPSLEQKLCENLSFAVAKFGDKDNSLTDEGNSETGNDFGAENFNIEAKTFLSGVILCVSKKLSSIQLELNRIVKSLGGEYRWAFDSACTHYVFQGKANDLNKEFREARQLGKKIVAPDWVNACREENLRVNENCYPHTFKSKLSLLVDVSSSRNVSNVSEQTVSPERNLGEQGKCSDKNLKPVEEPLKTCVDVGDQLDELIAAAASSKAAKRRAGRSSGNDSHCDGRITPKLQTPPHCLYSNMHSKPGSRNDIHNIDIACTEPSQSVPITWDDPTGRMEREKIAALDKFSEMMEDDICLEMKGDATPLEVPSPPVIRKFMFSTLPENLVEKYSNVITSLGGSVSDSKVFDEKASHLILNQLVRSEKFLASVASGKWILHTSYLDDSVSNEEFLSEELYEWGNHLFHSKVPNLSETTLKLCSCVFRWRTRLQNQTEITGAFHGWKVVVVADVKKAVSYTRILQAGGAEVTAFTTLNTGPVNLTHAFVEKSKTSNFDAEMKLLRSHEVKCLKPEFLANYLIEDSPLEENYLICNDTSVMPSTSKRQQPWSSNENRKKTRLK